MTRRREMVDQTSGSTGKETRRRWRKASLETPNVMGWAKVAATELVPWTAGRLPDGFFSPPPAWSESPCHRSAEAILVEANNPGVCGSHSGRQSCLEDDAVVLAYCPVTCQEEDRSSTSAIPPLGKLRE